MKFLIFIFSCIQTHPEQNHYDVIWPSFVIKFFNFITIEGNSINYHLKFFFNIIDNSLKSSFSAY